MGREQHDAAIIVDDEELSVKRLTRILRENGKIATCRAFLNPHEAYEYSRANAVDIAFLDISMPEIDGMKLKLRSTKNAELFAFLVCQRTASREEIIDTLWSGLTPVLRMKGQAAPAHKSF